MTARTQVALLCWSLFVWISQTGSACPYQECDCSESTITCVQKGLRAIPNLTSNSSGPFTHLLFSINSISSVRAGSLPSNLESISFVSNPIATIDGTAFIGSATTLKELYFSNALFARIPDALLQLQALTTLSMSEMPIQDWNLEVMKHIGQTVTTLYIDNVNLTTWPDWLENFLHLEDLSIDNNGIYVIPDDALDQIAMSLTQFTQDFNELKSIPQAMSKLTSLESLSLISNQISDTTNLPARSQLLSLTLSNNHISDADMLSLTLQPYSDYLTNFQIDNNKLTQLPDLDFLGEITQFDLSYNHLSDPYSGSIPSGVLYIDFGYNSLPLIPAVLSSVTSVKELYLSWNSVTDMRGDNIPSSVTTVDLTHNLITSLSASSFPQFCGIVTLRLSNNPIASISTDAFTNVHNLEELYLDSGQLTRVPLALKSLGNLRILDLTDNRSLVCTCLEKNLGSWAKLFYEVNLRGSCGLLSVYKFFTTLSPSCP